MKAQLEILVVGTNDKILEVVLRLLNKNEEWHATGVSNAEDVLIQCNAKEYQVLLIGAGLKDEIEKKLSTEVKNIYPSIHIIPHYGGGSGLLFAEIYLALAK